MTRQSRHLVCYSSRFAELILCILHDHESVSLSEGLNRAEKITIADTTD